MWRNHSVVLGMLIAAILPVLILDRWLLAPKGGSLPLDFRGMLVVPYLWWLLGHVVLSSLMLHAWRSGSLLQVHGCAALLSAVLLGAGWWGVIRIDAERGRVAHEARTEAKAALEATLTLQRWWFEPDPDVREAIHAVVATEHSGRLAVGVRGLTNAEFGGGLFYGEMRPQRWVEAGSRVAVVLPLKHVESGAPDRIVFNLGLFPDQRGSAPDRIYKHEERLPNSASPP